MSTATETKTTKLLKEMINELETSIKHYEENIEIAAANRSSFAAQLAQKTDIDNIIANEISKLTEDIKQQRIEADKRKYAWTLLSLLK